MPCFEASALNDNGEGLTFLRAVLDGSGHTGDLVRPPSWTRAGQHSRQSSRPKPRADEKRRNPLIVGVPVPVSAAYSP